jgi:hypothetical protein
VVSFPQVPPTKSLYTPLLSTIRATWTSLISDQKSKFNPNHRDIPLGAFLRSIEQASECEYFLAFLCPQTNAEALRRHTPCKTLHRLLITVHNSAPNPQELEYTLGWASDFVGRELSIKCTILTVPFVVYTIVDSFCLLNIGEFCVTQTARILTINIPTNRWAW